MTLAYCVSLLVALLAALQKCACGGSRTHFCRWLITDNRVPDGWTDCSLEDVPIMRADGIHKKG